MPQPLSASQASENVQTPAPIEVYEGGVMFPLIVFLCCPLMLWWSLMNPPQSGLRLFGILMGLFALAYSGMLVLRRRYPVMCMDERGASFPGVDAPVPWTDMTDFKMHTSGRSFTNATRIWFKLKPGVQPPAKFGDHRIKYLQTGHQIQVSIVTFANIRAMEFNDRVRAFFCLANERNQGE